MGLKTIVRETLVHIKDFAYGIYKYLMTKIIGLPTLNAVDLAAIECLAEEINKRRAYTELSTPLLVGGLHVPICATKYKGPNQTAGNDEIRAEYSLASRKIAIYCAGVAMPGTPESLNHLVRTLAHEATHAIQYDCFSKEQIEEASSLSKQSCESGTPADYQAYVACDVELPAHAEMITVDLRDQTLSAEQFEDAARKTWSYDYITEKFKEAENAEATLNKLLAVARKQYEALKPK